MFTVSLALAGEWGKCGGNRAGLPAPLEHGRNMEDQVAIINSSFRFQATVV